MFIELAEALDCPDCQAELGLVAFVDDLQDRRVVAGHLGCPRCGVGYAIRRGSIDLRPEAGHPVGPSASFSDSRAPGSPDPCPPERAMQVAALLGVRERPDARMLLDEGLAACAERIAEMGERLEVMSLVPDLDSGPGTPVPGVTPIAGATGLPWPFRARALHGIALLGGSTERLAEASRLLTTGGRLAVFEPAAEVLQAMREEEFEVHAAEALALVATRR